ncbi:hypothetical protein NGR_c19380 [Sinorhizobium fredii NGR234]|uniref:Uncharacterized protein n=1 Tax=Sinorhizobium fredii (strain NBRC 101917 / NGR234) TaxID=394 RepID=C3ME32_SINFN|nr:curli-like amyloid fiber formation chaperone CsgH [Sinorhizobium fredii]ACP25701.1 hypothetical protein NGR_c19380 [Sinorhizobium fredii NGR234]
MISVDAIAYAPIECVIEHSRTNNLTSLVATLHSDWTERGTYHFKVMTGSSTNVQAGAFASEQAGRQELSTIMVSAAPDVWTARLSVYGADGVLLCESSVP